MSERFMNLEAMHAQVMTPGSADHENTLPCAHVIRVCRLSTLESRQWPLLRFCARAPYGNDPYAHDQFVFL